jgi:hypothetical protein
VEWWKKPKKNAPLAGSKHKDARLAAASSSIFILHKLKTCEPARGAEEPPAFLEGVEFPGQSGTPVRQLRSGRPHLRLVPLQTAVQVPA